MKISNIFVFLTLFLFSTTLFANDTQAKNILVLHSYNQSMSWVQEINRAIDDVLEPGENNYILHIENMDTKRTYNEDYLKRLKEIYSLKYKNTKFDLILSSDNNAFDFLKENRDELFGNIPVSFCGVNDFKDSDLDGIEKFTGVAEFFDAKSTVTTALKLYPQATEVFVINDYLKTGRAWESTIKEQLAGLDKKIKISYAQNSSIEELQESIATLPKNAIVLLGVYFKDNKGKYFTYEKIGEAITSNSDNPVFCLLKFNLHHNVIGGNVISGYSQAKAMSKIAQKILSGEVVSSIPVVKKGVSEYIFDYNSLRRFNMKLSNLPANAMVLNKPISFYEQNREIVFASIFIFFILLLIVVIQLIINEKTKQSLKDKTGNFNLLFMNTPSPLCHVAANGEILMFNTAFEKLFGYEKEDIPTLDTWWVLAYPDEAYRQWVFETWSEAVELSTQTGEVIKPIVYNVTCKDGTTKVVEISGSSMGLEFIATFIDLTERIEAENLLKESNEKLVGLYEMAPLGIALTDMNGKYIEFNNAFSSICGYTPQELKALDYWELTPRKYSAHENAQLESLKQSGHYGPYEKEYIKKDGTHIPINLNGMIVTNSKGEELIWSIVEDISQRKEHQKMLEHIADYDPLTDLPNRTLFADRLQRAMIHVQRTKRKIVIAYLDLDGFKEVNDTYGHNVGDKLLIEVSKRMKSILREDDSIGRLGGDEFVILLNELDNAHASIEIVDRLLQIISQPIAIDKFSLNISVSIGLTYYPQVEEIDADQLLRQSDQAMYQAKITGKNRYYMLNPDRDINIREKNEKLEKINHAITNDEFVMHYQPKVNLRTGKVVGLEALVRWEHPQEGLLAPAQFLSHLEGNALYIQFDEMVVDKVLSQMSFWIQNGVDVAVSINISATYIQEKDFVQRVDKIISKYKDVVVSNIEIEILETSWISDITHVAEVLSSLNKIGIKSSLDDFGTGYSSLTYLRRLPVHKLKIDQSFVRDMLDDPEDFAIVDGVIGLASAFNKDVIAEGMEDIAHGDVLLKLGCELAQGYAIAKPMPALDVPYWIKNWKTEPSWRSIKPIGHESLQVLYAQIEHKAWIKKIDNILHGKINAVIEIDEKECRFGKWLHSVNADKNPELINNIITLHSQIHSLANELIILNTKGENTLALESLPELYELRDKLLSEVDALI